jgi:hypothetical protein
MRTRTLWLLAIVLTVAPVAVAVLGGGSAHEPVLAAVPRSGGPDQPARALAVLHRWDRRRSAAWAHSDARALGHLYLPGSRAGQRDVSELERWRHRGLRVVGLRQQVSSARVARDGRDTLVMVVTERTVDGVAVGRSRRTTLPVGGWATHRIRLRRITGEWRLDEVTRIS